MHDDGKHQRVYSVGDQRGGRLSDTLGDVFADRVTAAMWEGSRDVPEPLRAGQERD